MPDDLDVRLVDLWDGQDQRTNHLATVAVTIQQEVRRLPFPARQIRKWRVKRSVEKQLRPLLGQRFPGLPIDIDRISVEEHSITLVVALVTFGGAVYQFVKDYDKLRNNVALFTSDISKLRPNVERIVSRYYSPGETATPSDEPGDADEVADRSSGLLLSLVAPLFGAACYLFVDAVVGFLYSTVFRAAFFESSSTREFIALATNSGLFMFGQALITIGSVFAGGCVTGALIDDGAVDKPIVFSGILTAVFSISADWLLSVLFPDWWVQIGGLYSVVVSLLMFPGAVWGVRAGSDP